MFSSSWSMPLFAFLLGMLVISLFGKKGRHSPGEPPSVLNAARLPAPTINVTHSSCTASTLLFVYNITSIRLHFPISRKRTVVRRGILNRVNDEKSFELNVATTSAVTTSTGQDSQSC